MLRAMKLIPLPAGEGPPSIWVSPAHVAAVTRRNQFTGDGGVQLRGEVKVEGMPLHLVDLGEFLDLAAADNAWSSFLATMEG